MSAMPEDQLIELLLQLKKTTPEQARDILNSQPQISYALMALMVKLKAVNPDVFQQTLAAAGALPATVPAVVTSIPAPAPMLAPGTPPAPAPILHPQMSAIPQHIQPPGSRGNTPQQHVTPPPSLAQYSQPVPAYPPFANDGRPPPPAQPMFSAPPPQPAFNAPPPQASYAPPIPAIPDAFSNMTEEQKVMLRSVLAMTPDQIAMLGPLERQSVMQLRAQLGVS
ncbi:hypothetical protein K488DRAFT_83362 [Vararia minispora EC-137]|uniref:Uncharacterized protein n=1 Tax=Vararia minispora EC-137 TaxID=1314806 RepID=A0ACB8QTJ6_9AGAM|nr:hypothetical protein K488DRAFT_83362 [Vararia minispora EC-137]